MRAQKRRCSCLQGLEEVTSQLVVSNGLINICQAGRQRMVSGAKTNKQQQQIQLFLMNLSGYVWDQIFQGPVCVLLWGMGKILKKFRKGDSVYLG